jgi:hypothetical protein
MDRTLLSALDERDSEGALRFIEDETDPARVLAMYHGAIRHLYWSNKDLNTLVALGRHAVAFGVLHPDALKPITYDIGSFCWPGWDEPGITVDADALSFGAEAAALNLALAVQLNRPVIALANAHWLVGAHDLAAGRTEDAVHAFERSRAFAIEAQDEPTRFLADGYIAIARGEPIDSDEMRTLSEGGELLAQLHTAARVFNGAPLT